MSLRDALRERLAEVASNVTVEEWTCMGFCPRGPHIVLYPKGTWYAGVQADDLDEIIAHLHGGAPVQRLTDKVDPGLHALLLDFLDSRLA